MPPPPPPLPLQSKGHCHGGEPNWWTGLGCESQQFGFKAQKFLFEAGQRVKDHGAREQPLAFFFESLGRAQLHGEFLGESL